VTQSPIEDKLI